MLKGVRLGPFAPDRLLVHLVQEGAAEVAGQCELHYLHARLRRGERGGRAGDRGGPEAGVVAELRVVQAGEERVSLLRGEEPCRRLEQVHGLEEYQPP
eukprot:216932-Prorocentrum_minimum.AAC.4